MFFLVAQFDFPLSVIAGEERAGVGRRLTFKYLPLTRLAGRGGQTQTRHCQFFTGPQLHFVSINTNKNARLDKSSMLHGMTTIR